MNYYFLLEDEKSFMKVLPHWLEHIGFKSTRVASIFDVKENNYVLQSGCGVTQLVTRALFDTIDTIQENPGKINGLIVILDSEEMDAQKRKQQVFDKINEKYKVDELDFDVHIIVCNHCFETWLLGCKGLYPERVESNSDFYEYYEHYNIELNDPEYMTPKNKEDTIAKYHFHYLHELFRYKKIRYRKSKPDYVQSEDYFNGIIDRVETTTDINSFKEFLNILNRL